MTPRTETFRASNPARVLDQFEHPTEPRNAHSGAPRRRI